MIKKLAVFLILLLAFGTVLYAQEDNLTLKIAVIGPGDELYFWWGHIALIIEDSSVNQSYFFDYGIFDFRQDNFFYNFAFGRLLYTCGVSYAERNINIYKMTNRDIIIYTLDLSPDVKSMIRDLASENILPENKDYYYHHFDDNCSTRIRDIIDLATDGQFKKQFESEISQFTLRGHVRRHTYFSPLEDWALNFWMGQVIDNPISVWAAMFLPSEVGKSIENFTYIDRNGEERKLVTSVEVLNTSVKRPPVLEKPRKQWLIQLIFSLILSAVFYFFFYLYSKNKQEGRILAGFSISLCGLVFGAVSLLLYFMNLFTNHDYTFQNMNMIFCSPLLLVTVPFGIRYALTKDIKKIFVCDQIIRIIWLLTVLGIIISMILNLLPWFYQDNLTDQLLMLPIALVFSLRPYGLKEILLKWGFYGK